MKSKIKILMIDDELQFRVTTRKIFERRGFEVITADSGEGALEKLILKPDVVILDVKMAGMDGHETLAEINKRSKNLPVIMLTGHGTPSSAEIALITGAFDFLLKPCDIDVLAAKIHEAYESRNSSEEAEERTVGSVMIPLEEYSTITGDQTIAQAVVNLKISFLSKICSSSIMETGHRSILVMDHEGTVEGILSIRCLLEEILPGYLTAPKPSTADTIQYSPMFWKGMFTSEILKLMNEQVCDVMGPPPPEIDEASNLMEASYLMIQNKVKWLSVVNNGKVVGIIREQDLFFEIERILRK